MGSSTARLRSFLSGLPYSLSVAVFLVQVGLGIILFSTFQKFVPSELHSSDAWPGYLLAAYGGARFLCETPTGAISDRIERKLGLLLGFALMIPAIALMALVRQKEAYLLFSAGLGLGTAFLWPATYAISADLYPPERRGKVIGLLNFAQLLGIGLGSLIGAFLVSAEATVMFIVAIGSVVTAFIAAVIGIPNYRADGLFRRVRHAHRPSVWAIMSVRLATLSAIIVAVSISIALLVPAIRPFGEDQLGVSFSTMTLALIPAIVVGALFYVPAGHFADRFGRPAPLIAGQAILVLGLLAMSEAQTLLAASLLAIIVFLGNVLTVPAWNAAIMDLAPATHRGTIIGFSVALSGLGLAIGPAIGGLIVQQSGPDAAFRLSAAICAAAGVAVFLHSRAFSEHPGVEQLQTSAGGQ
jgi:MFS family permease